MNRKILIIFLLFTLILVGCSEESTSLITPDEVLDLQAEGDLILIDVRTVEEYAGGHIEGAVNIPLSEIEVTQTVPYEKDDLIVVYCRSGNRSGTAQGILLDAGYTNVKDLGGINEWPYDVIK